jgi:hypothetical protein
MANIVHVAIVPCWRHAQHIGIRQLESGHDAITVELVSSDM